MKSYTVRMHGKNDLRVYGTATVGTKGQIVIPSDAREELGLAPGEKVVIVGSPQKGFVGIMREPVFTQFLDKMRHHLKNGMENLNRISLSTHGRGDDKFDKK